MEISEKTVSYIIVIVLILMGIGYLITKSQGLKAILG